MMNVDKFWNIIDEVNEEVPYEHERNLQEDLQKSLENKNYVNKYEDEYVECLKNKLSNLDFGDIILFQNYFDEYKGYLYRYDVWYECAWAFQHSTDDGFEYFLRWIVSRGKKFYFSVCDDVKNIENLEWKTGYRHFESVSYVWIKVLREKYPDVLERIGDFVYNIDGLNRWERKKIENEVKEAFKNGNNDEESEVGYGVGRMWEDEAMIKRWDEYYKELGVYENEKSESKELKIKLEDFKKFIRDILNHKYKEVNPDYLEVQFSPNDIVSFSTNFYYEAMFDIKEEMKTEKGFKNLLDSVLKCKGIYQVVRNFANRDRKKQGLEDLGESEPIICEVHTLKKVFAY